VRPGWSFLSDASVGRRLDFPTSVLLVSLVDMLGSLSNDLLIWVETHPVGDPEALEAVM